MDAIIEESELTCPQCGFNELLTMPGNACLWYHECSHCQALLKPRPGDCCVFCSFGTVPCPPIQLNAPGQIGGGRCGAG